MLTHVFDDSAHMSQLFSTVLQNLVTGELIQAKRDIENQKLVEQSPNAEFNFERYFDSYIAKTYFKTASMISIGCRGVALMMNMDEN